MICVIVCCYYCSVKAATDYIYNIESGCLLWIAVVMRIVNAENLESDEDTGVEEIFDLERIQVILKAYHDSVFGGQFGMAKTYDRTKRRFH